MSVEVFSGNSSIIHTQLNFNNLINLANGSSLILYTTSPTEYLDLVFLSNGTINRTIQIKSVSDVASSSVIASIVNGASVNSWGTANRLIVPPNYRIVLENGGAVTNARVIFQGTSFYNSP